MILDELVTVLTYKINNNAEARKFIAALNHINNEGKKVNAALAKAFNSKPVKEFRRILAKARVAATGIKKAFHGLTNPIKRAVNWVKRLRNEQVKTNVAAKGMELIYSRIKAMGFGAAAMMAAMKLSSLATDSARIDRKLKLSADAGNAEAVRQQLYNSVVGTGESFESRVGFFADISRSKNSLGMSDTDMVGLTELVSKAIATTSTDKNANSGVMARFAKVMSSDNPSGRQLENLLDSSLGLSKAIADSFGVSVEQLKKMGKEGKITSKTIAKGVLKQAKNINKEFAKTPKTFADGMENVRTMMLEAGRKMEFLNKVGDAFFRITEKVADNFDDLVHMIQVGGIAGGLMYFNSLLRVSTGLVAGLVSVARPLLLPFAKAALAAYGMYLIGDDILVWLKGGDSLLGEWIGSFDEVKQKVTEFLKPLTDIIGDIDLGGDKLKKWGSIGLAIGAVLFAIRKPLKFIFKALIWVLKLGRFIIPVFKVIAMAVAGISAPMLIWIALIAAIAAAVYYLWNNWDEVCAWIGEAWDAVCAWAKKKWEEFKKWFGEKVDEMKKWASELGDKIMNKLGEAADAAKKAWESVTNWLSNAIKKATDFLGITKEVQEVNKAMKGGKNDWDGNWGNKTTSDTKQGSVGSVVGAIQGAAALTKKFANSELGQNIAASAKSYAKNGLPVTPVGTVPAHKTNNQTNNQTIHQTNNITTVEAMKTQEIANATTDAASKGRLMPNVEVM